MRSASLTRLRTAASAVLVPPAAGSRDDHSGAPLDRPLDTVAEAILLTWDALDSGNLEVAEAVTGVALVRVDQGAEWPILVAHRLAVLLARGEPERAAAEFDRHVSAERWQAWQRSPDAPGWWAFAAEFMLARSPGHAHIRSLGALAESVRSMRVGTVRRWCAGAREIAELAVPVRGAQSGLLAAADAAMPSLPARTAWTLGLLSALVRLRAGEESLAVQTVLAAGAGLRHRAAPIVLALATKPEIETLNRRLPDLAPRRVRESLALALGYAGRPDTDPTSIQLVERELNVLDGVRRGLTNAEIAQELFLSVNTVKFHRANLYRKLRASSRSELLAEALRLGL